MRGTRFGYLSMGFNPGDLANRVTAESNAYNNLTALEAQFALAVHSTSHSDGEPLVLRTGVKHISRADGGNVGGRAVRPRMKPIIQRIEGPHGGTVQRRS